LHSYRSRCIQDAGPGLQARFSQYLEMSFKAVNQEARTRDEGVIPKLKSYIDHRRETSGCQASFDFIEYGLHIELPDFVVDDPVMKALNQGAIDFIAWSNVRVTHCLDCRTNLDSGVLRISSPTTSSKLAEIRTTCHHPHEGERPRRPMRCRPRLRFVPQGYRYLL